MKNGSRVPGNIWAYSTNWLITILLALLASCYEPPQIDESMHERMRAKLVVLFAEIHELQQQAEELVVPDPAYVPFWTTIGAAALEDYGVRWPTPWRDDLRSMTVGPVSWRLLGKISHNGFNLYGWQYGHGTTPFEIMHQGRMPAPQSLRERLGSWGTPLVMYNTLDQTKDVVALRMLLELERARHERDACRLAVDAYCLLP